MQRERGGGGRAVRLRETEKQPSKARPRTPKAPLPPSNHPRRLLRLPSPPPLFPRQTAPNGERRPTRARSCYILALLPPLFCAGDGAAGAAGESAMHWAVPTHMAPAGRHHHGERPL
eukprot:362982-Chlamydomonas_euryale.AAC.17